MLMILHDTNGGLKHLIDNRGGRKHRKPQSRFRANGSSAVSVISDLAGVKFEDVARDVSSYSGQFANGSGLLTMCHVLHQRRPALPALMPTLRPAGTPIKNSNARSLQHSLIYRFGVSARSIPSSAWGRIKIYGAMIFGSCFR